ncbi:hybrid sensor histidine kinase/response regulator [Desulforamulus aquiferis]|uniref:Stage 0 sporulation protein A homolog n=1 Tax=Desulforamulus aquiferis TaxID=1397668 RepID=A0AAW7ZE68_9FIRM|nr:ATP-binding protein [Desulforamulus aquiferis]MDO7788059.1 response regulator [Desulforamulus aquiferis]
MTKVDIELQRKMCNPPDTNRTSWGKVLVVDDSVLHLETVKLYLEADGFQVFCAGNTSDAWLILKKEKPDLVLLDVRMPGENGIDFLRNMKVHFGSTIVVIMTAFGSEETAAMALKLGAFDYIKKPLKFNNLSKIVEKALSMKNKIINHNKSIEALKNAYEKLQVSADSILQCMSAGVVAVDNSLNIRIINQKFIEFLEKDREIVVGQNFYYAFPEFEKYRILRSTLENQRSVRMQEIKFNIGHIVKTIIVNTDIIYDHHGSGIGAVATLEDITELRHKEEMLRDRERLAIVGQMAAGMAHEIKNPLTVIKGFVQLLARTSDPGIKVYVDIIDNETTRMNQVIQDFLQLAKPKSLERNLMNINELVKQMYPIIESLALIKKHNCIVKLDKNTPSVLMDSAQIKQVILNLCQNAMEAMDEGGNLTVETTFLPAKGEVCLDIKDTGCGIPQEKIKSIGVPFYTTKAEGTGLGLSICFSIVDKHKGRIDVQSQEGQGTTFSVILPIER